jgi:hypothetical protein
MLCFKLLFCFLHVVFFIEFEKLKAGQDLILNIMRTGPGGIEDVNQKIVFAKTQGLAADLKRSELSLRFGPLTKVGHNYLTHSEPISPQDTTDTIKNRQKFIKFLIDNPDVRLKYDALMSQAAKCEAVVMEFNQQKYLKEGWPKDWLEFIDNHLFEALVIVNIVSVVFDNIPDNTKSNVFKELSNNPGKNFAQLIGKSAVSKIFQICLYQDVLRKNYNFLHVLNRLIYISQEIESLCSRHDLKHQFSLDMITSNKGKNLLGGLKKDWYSRKSQYVLMDHILFVKDVCEHHKELAPLYGLIGEIDAQVAIAKKMASLEKADHKICFSEFLQHEQPNVRSKDFWNMLVSQENVVVNGIDEHKNIILTGPNAGGKSTVLRAITQNILLSQTFGVAAASEFKVTPFDIIESHLDVADDIIKGRSRYQHELEQGVNILRTTEKLGENEKYFVVFDEPFSATNPDEGQEVAARFIDNLGSRSNIFFACASHYPSVAKIQSRNQKCTNYEIEPALRDKEGKLIRDSCGNVAYPYKLRPGTSKDRVGIELAEQAGLFEKKIKKLKQ